MDSNYSAIPINSSIELQQVQEDYNVFASQDPKSSKKLLPIIINGFDGDLHGEDLDDDLPFIVKGDLDTGSGSGTWGAVFNLATSIIGAGIMALPATMKVLGLVLGLILIVLMGILSEISVELLVRFAVLCKASSYGEVVQATLGRSARVLSEICIIVNNAGVLVVYLIIIGDVLSGSLHHVGVFDQWLGNGFWDHRKVVVLIIVFVCLAPLCFLEKIDSLSLSSAASVALAVVFVVVCAVVAFVKLAEGRLRRLGWPRMLVRRRRFSTCLW
ncbi:hypothetical protein Sjap_011054 [Stephania japonica]|uniref:Amino acid transporter transmembrane domain-containing protein n=1 Tax=Stephania japonica TaxID=461633 RepID=A0AAP0P4C3_9MAGN